MEFKRSQRRTEVDINLTPLIDVVFLLLIFFMVSTTFVRQSQLSLTLPEASAEPADLAPAPIEVLISAEGQYTVNEQQLPDAELDTLLRALAGLTDRLDPAEQPLVITADGAASHQSVVRAMDAAGQLGLTRLSLTTRQPSSE